MTKQYIGDGVYVEVERGMLKLTTFRTRACAAYTNGPDTIYLEKPVFAALVDYAKACEFECYQNRPKRNDDIEPTKL